MKVAFFELEKWEQGYISKNLEGHKLSFFNGKLTKNSLKKIRDAEALAVFIYSKVDATVLSALPKLRLVATMSTGYDHIDVMECKKRGIAVCNVPAYGENTVAEHTFALILCLSRKIHRSYERTRMADFSAMGLRGFDLKGKTIGVVGSGHIGKHVIRIAKGFEMDVIVYEKFPDEKLAAEMGFRYVPLDELYAKSHIITFHVPLLDETKHMFNSQSLKKIRKGCIVINTSRGGIIDTNALLQGLSKGIIGGAGLDVLEGEYFIREEKQVISPQFRKSVDLHMVLQNHVLLRHPNVLITPHNAFNSQEALERILSTTMGNISMFEKGRAAN